VSLGEHADEPAERVPDNVLQPTHKSRSGTEFQMYAFLGDAFAEGYGLGGGGAELLGV
jgi:hypothetical protein